MTGDLTGLLPGLAAMELYCFDSGLVRQLNDPRREFVSEDTDRENLGRESTGDVVDLLRRDWRVDGAKINPTASAPMATDSNASSSLVMPQILTNMQMAQRTRRRTVDAGSVL